jgi:hypothetical protein
LLHLGNARKIEAAPDAKNEWVTKLLRVDSATAQAKIPRDSVDKLPRKSPTLFLTSEGTPWTEDGFRSSFSKARGGRAILRWARTRLRSLRSGAREQKVEKDCKLGRKPVQMF